MNDVDCPEAKLVAVLTRYDDRKGIWHALYLSKRTNMAAPYGPNPKPLSDFGKRVEWKFELGEYRVVDDGGPCIATYDDGKPRAWQDHSRVEWWQARPRAMKAIAGMGTTPTTEPDRE
jgi:hypothetical protein